MPRDLAELGLKIASSHSRLLGSAGDEIRAISQSSSRVASLLVRNCPFLALNVTGQSSRLCLQPSDSSRESDSFNAHLCLLVGLFGAARGR